MKRIFSLLSLTTMLASLAAAQAPLDRIPTDVSPAAQSIARARETIHARPTEYAGYNLLATALVRCAQETSDAVLYAQAEETVERSFQLAPGNFDTEKIQVSILLGEHEYPAALEAAKALNRRLPDDVMVYGLLTDANVELGNYKDAEDAAQWMLNLRPGNLPALTRAARLRELFGDPEGAYELMDMAYQSTPPTDTGERASMLTKMGHLRLLSGKIDAAEQLLLQALTARPNDPVATESLAQVRRSQKRYAEAVALLEQRDQGAAHPEQLFALAEALQLSGRDTEAKKVFADFEAESLAVSLGKDNANHELVYFYADHAQQPEKALKVAQQEYAWRRDVYTLDAYAWALHANGEDAEARKQVEIALAVGIRDAKILDHAGEIALKLGDRPAAERYLKESAALDTNGSEQARLRLAALGLEGFNR
ncbi:MAG: hypothetical protein ABSD75_22615 [Terriglobales bacterium]